MFAISVLQTSGVVVAAGDKFLSGRPRNYHHNTNNNTLPPEEDAEDWTEEEDGGGDWARQQRGIQKAHFLPEELVYDPSILYENLSSAYIPTSNLHQVDGNYNGLSYLNGFIQPGAHSPSTILSFSDELQPWITAETFYYDEDNNYRGSSNSNHLETGYPAVTTLTYHYPLSGSDEFNMTRGQNNSVSGDGSSSSSMPYLRYPSRAYQPGHQPTTTANSYLNSISPPPMVVSSPAERPLSRSRSYGNAKYPVDYSHHQDLPARTDSPKGGNKDPSSKKWSFGALFRKKSTGSNLKSPVSSSSLTFIPPTDLPPHLVRNNMPKLGKAEALPGLSSELSSSESEVKSSAAVENGGKRQNFLSRRLSKRKEKKSAQKNNNIPSNSYLEVPGSRNGHNRTEASNGASSKQGWETTKKASPIPTNYSSSGSYTLSFDDLGRPIKTHRPSVKDAVKARAVARRESFFNESSSSEDDNASSSLQGSHSSLSSRTRGVRGSKRTTSQRPELVKPPTVPDPNSYQLGQSANAVQAPPSPRWEARVVYTEETIEQDEPVIIRLPSPRKSQQSPLSQQYEQYSTSYTLEPARESPAQIQRAGLQVPLIVPNSDVSPYPADDRTYANLPTLLEDSSAPPPPPRDFRQQYQSNSNTRGQQFYRPVSCSYLDSYRNYQEQDYTPNYSPITISQSGSADQRPVPYNIILPRTSPSPVAYPSSNAVRTLPETGKSAFKRSPSEPPEMKTHSAMADSARKRNALTPGLDSPRQKAALQKSAPPPLQPVMSKLGYPVRKLTEASKLPATQSPVHMQASEFWRKKEQEITGSASSPTTSYQVKQKPFLNRNRSADSSPVPGPKSILRTSPRNQLTQRQQQGQNSNDSISSLSSISAEAPSPSNLHQQNGKTSPKLQVPALTRPQSLNFRTVSPIVDRSRSPFSACERLNVRLPSANQHAKEAFAKQVVRPKSPEQRPKLVDKVPGGSEALANALAIKATGKNLEDALNELEDMYKSLRLSDEDLLDRAERRDLPTAHQELRNAPMLPAFRFSPLGSFESLNSSGHAGTPGTGSSLGGSSFYGSEGNVSATGNRIRAPPLRRSCRPDTVADDMAKRRFDHGELKPLDPRSIVSKAGCFMMKSPAFSPPSSPLPTDIPNHLVSYTHDPDLTLDDVLFRNYKRANSIKIIDPQPLFGIPLGPLTPAPASDYLHSQPEEKYRPIFRNTKRPDIVKDDIAFRNLRKDLSQENNLNKDWTPRLFNKEHQMFTYNIHDNNGRPASSKKLRAIRSLSANISHLIPFKESMVNNEVGKWNSFSDLYGQKLTTPNHKQPSWVEEIERLQQRASSSDALPALQPEVLYPLDGPTQRAQEAISAKKLSVKSHSCSANVSGSDSSKARRPWTDVLLESFEQEKEEIERLNAAANQILEEHHDKADGESNNNFLDDVFQDADAKPVIQSPVESNSSPFSTPPETTPPTPATLSSPDPKPTPKKRSQPKETKDASGNNASIFTPLPPPRKVHQIHLDSFSQSAEPPSPTKSKNSTEDELSTLIDALVRDADSCIPPTRPQPKSILKSTSTSAIEKSYAGSRERHQTQDENQNLAASPEGAFGNKPSPFPDNHFSEENGNKPHTGIASSAPHLNPASSSNYPSKNTSLDNSSADVDNPATKSSSLSQKNSKAVAAAGAQTAKGETAIKNGGGGTTDISLGKSVFRIKMPWGNSSSKPSGAAGKSGSKSTAESESEATSGNQIKQENESGKDKSSKRKSNLNRALAEEPVKVAGSIAVSCALSKHPSPDTSQRVSSLDEMLSKVEEKLAKQSKNKPKPIDNKYVKPATFSSCNPRRDILDDGDSSSDYSRLPVEGLSKTTSTNAPAAPGMTCLKRLLQKERFNCDENNCDKRSSNNVSPSLGGGIKKSPSLGSNFSWPKFSGNSSPFFSKKNAEKNSYSKSSKALTDTPASVAPALSQIVPETAESLTAAVEDKILALNVAQKANFFMQLEHEQRFSKWRHDARSERSTPVSYMRTGSKEKDAGFLPADLKRVSQTIEIPAKPVPPVTKPIHTIGPLPWRNTASSKLETDGAHLPPFTTTPASLRNSEEDITLNGPRSFGSASKLATLHEEGKQTFPPCYASSASVRHTPFGRDSSTRHLQTNGKFTPAMGRRSAFDEFYTPISWAPWENSALQEGHYENNFASPISGFKRHGSTSDIEIKSHHSLCPQHGFKAWRKLPDSSQQPAQVKIPCPPKVKNQRVKSMIMAGSSDAENYSEDGEVSSGGQEVAEIISKSYENSPMVRKKHKKQQQPPPNLSKEIWRKCFHQPPAESQRETNDIFYDASSEFECYTHAQIQVQAATSPPSTSNLFHILNVLSSSNDDLDEKVPPRPPSTNSSFQQTHNFPDAAPNLNTHDSTTAQKLRTELPSTALHNSSTDVQLSDTTSFSDVKREEDLLVIKKGVPLLRRKSSGKSRNPLKALAARMDFKFN